MAKKSKYPKYDIGSFKPDPNVNIGWGEGTLKDGRPFRAELLSEPYGTVLVFYIPTNRLAKASEKKLLKLLVRNGLISINSEKYSMHFHSALTVRAVKISDASGNVMWDISMLCSGEDAAYRPSIDSFLEKKLACWKNSLTASFQYTQAFWKG